MYRQQSRLIESTSGRHSRVDLGGVSTAISKARASLVQLCITSALYQPRSKRKHVWRSGIYRDQSESMSGTVVSTRAVYQPRSAKQRHTRRSCISPARYINCNQRTESLSGAAVYQRQSAQQTPLRHRPPDIRIIASTSVYQQWAAEPKARLDHTAALISTVYQPRSAKRIPAAISEQIMQKKQNSIGTRHTV